MRVSTGDGARQVGTVILAALGWAVLITILMVANASTSSGPPSPTALSGPRGAFTLLAAIAVLTLVPVVSAGWLHSQLGIPRSLNRFDAEAYEAELRRAHRERPWERHDETVARLVAEAFRPQRQARRRSFDWASAEWGPGQVVLSVTDHRPNPVEERLHPPRGLAAAESKGESLPTCRSALHSSRGTTRQNAEPRASISTRLPRHLRGRDRLSCRRRTSRAEGKMRRRRGARPVSAGSPRLAVRFGIGGRSR